MGLLARCGAATRVLLSTCGRLDRRAQRSSIVHGLSPLHPRSVPSGYPGQDSGWTRYGVLSWASARKALVSGGLTAAPVGSKLCTARSPAQGRRAPQGRRGDEISPTCAHSWGQLLDLSTLVTVRRATVD